MAVKEVKKEVCKKVRIRRDAVTGRSSSPLVSFPQPPSWASRQSGVADNGISRGMSYQPMSPLSSPEDSPNTSMHDHEIALSDDQVEYQALSVDVILDSPYFEVCKLMEKLDLVKDCNLIAEMIMHYSLEIDGLPECPEEDVQLAVYLFLEDTFSIQSRLVKCQKIRWYDGKMDVKVVFDTIRMKYDVLKKNELLEGTEVKMKNDPSLTWLFEKIPDGPPL